MKDQHKQISGYRDLNQQEIDLINEIKAVGWKVKELCGKIETDAEDYPGNEVRVDLRWLKIGMTDLQKGFMAITRAVARPDSF